jgi:hypothetical protein
MTRLNASLVGLVALTLVAVSERVHGQCVVFEDPADMFRRADAVFVGTVRRTEPTGALGHHIVMHRASFEIEQVWKGQSKKFETVGTVEAFEPGKRYLVFAGAASTEESRAREGSFQTSLECGWAQIESSAARNLRWLRDRFGSPMGVREK